MEVNISQTFGGGVCENWEHVYNNNQSDLSYKTHRPRRGSNKKIVFFAEILFCGNYLQNFFVTYVLISDVTGIGNHNYCRDPLLDSDDMTSNMGTLWCYLKLATNLFTNQD